jgi:selenocysteine lyase/cysteine desulfurase
MADRFYSLIKGEQSVWQVTEGASTSSEAVELRVNDSIYTTKLDVILLLEVLEDYLKTKETSPIA